MSKDLIEHVINSKPADFSFSLKEELTKRAKEVVAESLEEAKSK